MKKLLLYLLFSCATFTGNAQDSVAFIPPDKIRFTLKDIKIDSSEIEPVHFPAGFKQKYKSSAFEYDVKLRQKNAWERFKEWLSDLFSRLFSFTNTEASMFFVEVLLKTIAVIIVLIVIYLIVKVIMNKEGQWIFGRNSDKKIIRYDEIEKNLHLVDFEKLIKETIQSGEQRLAIRYYYLWLLKKLSEKEIIEWDVEKTNSDYLHEIKNEGLKKSFSYLSYLYNYIWYGEFEIDDTEFEKAKVLFEKTIKTL